MKGNFKSKLSRAVQEGTGYRLVIGKIVSFAKNEIKEKYPDMSYEDRIIMAQTEPFWTAAKEVRELTKEELEKFKNS